ncbi:MAG TPA: Na(+)-translocating NADH-quinone reductase subunit C [Flavobacteriaceae bacterium]|nr:Na(+)-translocating NADH-quinone reductase subunit C [Flavobacteriaceae bacterium]|tara:strand:- start:971 stop:1723 length:753 start_codon:yes stop_codon:yes gene_type:complete
MAINTDKNSYTLLFAIGMVIIVGTLLAAIDSSLKERIETNKILEKQQNILYAIGINNNQGNSVSFISKDQAPSSFNEYIVNQIYIQGDNVIEDEEAYLIEVKKEKTLAKDSSYDRRLPLFIAERDGKKYYVAPIRGKGLWDAVWAYVAMDENMTILGAYFDHKAETPGLGANINQRFFMDDFIGEKLLDSNGNFKGITVSKSNLDPRNKIKDDNEVDAIAGATITGDGISAMIKSDLRLYMPYFKKLKQD